MHTANEFYRQRFGCKVYKLSLDGGELLVEGRIDGLNYEDAPARKGSFFSRLLG